MDPLAVIAVVGAAWALVASFLNRRRLRRLGQELGNTDVDIASIRESRALYLGELKEVREEQNELGGDFTALKEQLRQLNRKKVRRRNPQTGRFESVCEDEVDA